MSEQHGGPGVRRTDLDTVLAPDGGLHAAYQPIVELGSGTLSLAVLRRAAQRDVPFIAARVLGKRSAAGDHRHIDHFQGISGARIESSCAALKPTDTSSTFAKRTTCSISTPSGSKKLHPRTRISGPPLRPG